MLVNFFKILHVFAILLAWIAAFYTSDLIFEDVGAPLQDLLTRVIPEVWNNLFFQKLIYIISILILSLISLPTILLILLMTNSLMSEVKDLPVVVLFLVWGLSGFFVKNYFSDFIVSVNLGFIFLSYFVFWFFMKE